MRGGRTPLAASGWGRCTERPPPRHAGRSDAACGGRVGGVALNKFTSPPCGEVGRRLPRPGGGVALNKFTSPPCGEVGRRLRRPGGGVALNKFTSPPCGEVGRRLRRPGGGVAL